MNKNLENAFNEADNIVGQIGKKYQQLLELKEIYKYIEDQKIINEDFSIFEFIELVEKTETNINIYSNIFGLAKEYRSIEKIDSKLKYYKDLGTYWCKIRDELGSNH